MNVHRRDRARLKQSDDQYLFSKSSSSPEHPSHKNSETSCYTLVFNSKPNRFKSQHPRVIDLPSSPSSLLYLPPSRASSGLPQKQDTSSPSPFAIEPSSNSENILSSSPWSCPDTFVKRKRCDLYETPVIDGSKKRKIERDVPKNGDTANVNLENTTDLSLRMNLVIHEGYPITAQVSDEEIWRGDHSLKRRRMRESSSQPSIFVSSLSCKSAIITRKEEIKHKVDHFEDIDLELRLGADPPKGN